MNVRVGSKRNSWDRQLPVKGKILLNLNGLRPHRLKSGDGSACHAGVCDQTGYTSLGRRRGWPWPNVHQDRNARLSAPGRSGLRRSNLGCATGASGVAKPWRGSPLHAHHTPDGRLRQSASRARSCATRANGGTAPDCPIPSTIQTDVWDSGALVCAGYPAYSACPFQPRSRLRESVRAGPFRGLTPPVRPAAPFRRRASAHCRARPATTLHPAPRHQAQTG